MAATTSWADATNTGVPPGVTLTPSGGLIITQPGTVISGLDIQGTVVIQASNVTLQNCKITAAAWSLVTVADGVTGAVVQNCEINGVGTGNDGSCGISGHGTFIGNNIYNVENGFSLAGNNTIIENNYVHNLQASGAPHYDGIQIDGGVSNVTISHNTIINDHNQTSAIMIDNWSGAISNIQVDNNLLAGGGYTVYSDGQFSSSPISGVSFTNNHMASGSFGLTAFDQNSSTYTSPTYTGNVNDGATLVGTLNTSANIGSATTTTGGTTAPTGAPTDAGGTTTSGGTTTDTGGTTAGAPDAAAPAVPVLVSDSIVNTNHVHLSGTADANTSITVYDGNTVVGTGTTDASGAWNVTTSALSDGSHGLTATATDATGHVSAMSGPLDPVIASTAPNTGSQQPDAPSQQPDPASQQPDASTTTSSVDIGTTGSHATSDSASTVSGTAAADSTAGAVDGSHTTDASGQTGAPSTDLSTSTGTDAPTLTAPTLTAYSHDGAEVGSTTSSHDIVLKGTADANSNISVFDGEKAIGTATADDSGSWSFDANHLASGSHSFSATATDAAGNTSTASEPDDVTVSQPVEFTNLSESTHIATIKGTADANSQVQLYEGSTSLGTVTAGADGTWSFKTGYMSNQVHTFTAQEVDSSGQTIVQSSGEAILGSPRSNTLTSTSGDDYLFGNGHPDTFVFAANFGHDVIKDFVAGGRGHDTIQFSTSEFDSFASVLSHASQSGHDVVIASGNDTLTLKNTSLTSLNSHDFHFA